MQYGAGESADFTSLMWELSSSGVYTHSTGFNLTFDNNDVDFIKVTICIRKFKEL